MNAPLLSINIPTYGRASYLRALLESIAPDMAVLGGEVEVSILDNCSPDNTADVVATRSWRFASNYVRHSHNIGPQANIHMAHRIGSGRFVWVLGDDDFLREGQLGRVVQALRSDPGVLLMSFARETPDRRAVGYVRIGTNDFSVTRESAVFDLGAIDSLIGFLSANIIRRDWIDRFPPAVYQELDILGELGHATIYYAAIAAGERVTYLSGEPLVQTVDNSRIQHDSWIYVCVRYCMNLPQQLLRLGFERDTVLPYFRKRLFRECFRRVLSEKYRGHSGLRVALDPVVRQGLGVRVAILFIAAAVPGPVIRCVYNILRTPRR